jgi:hypothetical protein
MQKGGKVFESFSLYKERFNSAKTPKSYNTLRNTSTTLTSQVIQTMHLNNNNNNCPRLLIFGGVSGLKKLTTTFSSTPGSVWVSFLAQNKVTKAEETLVQSKTEYNKQGLPTRTSHVQQQQDRPVISAQKR